ncbi:hypothetical protein ACFVIY_18895 [Streptomyces sp. NPDC127166]
MAFTEGGAALGRDAQTDAALFAELLESRSLRGREVRDSLDELYDAYGRA